MLKFEINGVKYPVPTKWGDVTFAKYLEIMNATVSDTDPLGLLSIITDIPIPILENCSVEGIGMINNAVSFIGNEGSMDGFNVYDNELKLSIKDLEYWKLQVCNQEIKQRWQSSYPDKKELSIAEINAVYMNCVPTFVKTYLDFDILDQPMPNVYGMAVFFCKKFRDFSTVTVS